VRRVHVASFAKRGLAVSHQRRRVWWGRKFRSKALQLLPTIRSSGPRQRTQESPHCVVCTMVIGSSSSLARRSGAAGHVGRTVKTLLSPRWIDISESLLRPLLTDSRTAGHALAMSRFRILDAARHDSGRWIKHPSGHNGTTDDGIFPLSHIGQFGWRGIHEDSTPTTVPCASDGAWRWVFVPRDVMVR
jgi:hypothetical protein